LLPTTTIGTQSAPYGVQKNAKVSTNLPPGSQKKENATYEVIEDFVAYHPHHLKRLLRSDRVDKHVAVDTNGMARIQDAIFVL
jgi:hypothetical protein